MSSKNNVNPDHYKIAGRQRQGENIIQEIYKREYSQSKTGVGSEPFSIIYRRPVSKGFLPAKKLRVES